VLPTRPLPSLDLASRSVIWWMDPNVELSIQNITLLNPCAHRFGNSGPSRVQFVPLTTPLRARVVLPDQLLHASIPPAGQILASGSPLSAAKYISAPTASRVLVEAATMVIGQHELDTLNYLAAVTCGWWSGTPCVPIAMLSTWAAVPNATAAFFTTPGQAGQADPLRLQNLAAVKLAALSLGTRRVGEQALRIVQAEGQADQVSTLLSGLSPAAPDVHSLGPHTAYVTTWPEMPITGHRMRVGGKACVGAGACGVHQCRE
jgi:hypothetical protein